MQKGGSSGDGDRNSFRKSVVALLLIDPSKYLTSCLRHSNVPIHTGAGCVGVAGWGSVDLLDGRGLFCVDWVAWDLVGCRIGCRFGGVGRVGRRIGSATWSG